jgi:hypothetical protein
MHNPIIVKQAEIPLTSYGEWWATLNRKTRNMIRRSQRLGVTVKRVTHPDVAFWDGVQGIFNESPTRRNIPYKMYGVDPTTHFSRFRDEDSLYLGAYLGGELIGFMHLLRCRRGVFAVMVNGIPNRFGGDSYSVTQFQGLVGRYSTAQMDALIDGAVKTCCGLGIKRIIYTRTLDENSLGDFKRRHGFVAVQRLRPPAEFMRVLRNRIIGMIR